ncbi:dimethylglycine catabolism A [Microdochium nivale]|nr:dimethylglycine catabolism A [Microdochium nivale]
MLALSTGLVTHHSFSSNQHQTLCYHFRLLSENAIPRVINIMELHIAKPLQLRCGLVLPNRLVKAAMTESLGDDRNLPGSAESLNLYRHWAHGGWGLVITGNVQVDSQYLGDPHDFAVNNTLLESANLAAYGLFASAANDCNTKTVVQICHPGRQIAFNKGTIAPSAIPMDFGSGILPNLLNRLLFGTPRAMDADEIRNVIKSFADAARLLSRAGFAGVELHAAHGYLLSQFLSPLSNKRSDDYAGSAVARARIVVEIIEAIRRQVPDTFCIGVKMNSADAGSAAAMRDSLEQIGAITRAGIDFLEISGGTFENPTFSTGTDTGSNETVKSSTALREAFFLDYAAAVRSAFPAVPLIVTGGFRSRRAMEVAVREGKCDFIGLARPAIVDPALPRSLILNTKIPESEAVAEAPKIKGSPLAGFLGIKLMGVGPERDWYTKKMHELGTKEIEISSRVRV